MAEHNSFGKSGEDLAAEYLMLKGYLIKDRNWRSGHKELDIVALKDNCLVIVEVKTRRNQNYGRAEYAVSPMKMRRTVIAADAYIRYIHWDGDVRFDIITVVGYENQKKKIEHFEDAFRSPLFTV